MKIIWKDIKRCQILFYGAKNSKTSIEGQEVELEEKIFGNNNRLDRHMQESSVI